MNTQKEILSFLSVNREFLLNNYSVIQIALFGSFARDEQTQTSDVDILVEFKDDIKNIYDVKSSLKNFLSNAFERSVDLARIKYLKPYAKESILKDAKYV
ncbi:MAG: nucleotidyltransferase family protein [Epsilonproteobacteria bacterium]|nr:nucleotidyltransferase family protein [Campylobacterota bacterium]